ncbi:MAG: hypothetical protein A2Z18_02665 [Armatimonadetes bacterium RBG_16_58_9]|nr:MAG: hypothetical protein A2Z18_02665 [Armatimonadetes bacterium RBG_16_58_9]
MKRRIVIAAVVVAALVAAAGAAKHVIDARPGVDLDELVTRALSSERSPSYVARVVTTSKYAGRTLGTTATVYADGPRQRIEYRDGTGGGTYVIASDREILTCLPAQGTVLVGLGSGRISSDAMARLVLENYRPIFEGKRVVAGRDAYVVLLVRRNARGTAKKMWIDSEYYTILKSIDYAASGEPRSEMEVRHIAYGRAISPARFAVQGDSKLKVVTVTSPAALRDVGRELGISVNEPCWLPRGYVLEDASLFSCQCGCGHKSAQLAYADGLNTISVFQTPADGSCRSTECGHAGHGCTMLESELARVAQVEKRDKTVVVVADLRPEEARRIAESVR